MAYRYVWMDTAQDDSDANWNSSTISYTTLAAAIAASSGGDIIFVASIHVEDTAGSFDCTGFSEASHILVISVDKTSGTPPANAYERQIDTSGEIDGSDITIQGYVTMIGLYFVSDDNVEIGSIINSGVRLIDCDIEVADNVTIGAPDHSANTRLENVNFVQTTPATSGFPYVRGSLVWTEGSYSLDTGSITAVVTVSEGADIFISNVDFSGIAAADYLVGVDATDTYYIVFRRCKLPASFGGVIQGTYPLSSGGKVIMQGGDDSTSDEYWRIAEHYYEGVIVTDTTVYLDATYDGSNNYSIKMTTSANSKEWYRPLRFKLAEIWCAANATLKVNTLAGEAYNDDDFWIEFEHGTSGEPATGIVNYSSRTATIQTTPAALSTESDPGWTEGASGFSTYQYVQETLTSAAGIVTVWACFAKASKTIYVCPKVEVS